MAWLKTYVLECLESIVPIIASRPVRYMFHHVHCQLTAVPSRPACLATAKKAFAAIGFEGLLCEGNPGQLLHQWRQPSSVKRPVRRQQLLEVFLQENGLHPCPCTPSLQLFHLGLAVRVLLADLFFCHERLRDLIGKKQSEGFFWKISKPWMRVSSVRLNHLPFRVPLGCAVLSPCPFALNDDSWVERHPAPHTSGPVTTLFGRHVPCLGSSGISGFSRRGHPGAGSQCLSPHLQGAT